jgi:chromosome segregation ATPase
MNSKTVAVVLAVICLVLAGTLFYRHDTAVKERDTAAATIRHLSNEWTQTSGKLEDQKLVNLALERDLVSQFEQLRSVSNHLASTSASLTRTQAEAKAALESALAQTREREGRIAELEGERNGLTKKMTDLNDSILELEDVINETQRKLESSEGDREHLFAELKRLDAEKADLERQFNDIAILREQVRKLRDEMSIARRLDWIRRGLYGDLKGAERMQRGLAAAPVITNRYDLNVELHRDGGARIIPASDVPVTPGPGSVSSSGPGR